MEQKIVWRKLLCIGICVLLFGTLFSWSTVGALSAGKIQLNKEEISLKTGETEKLKVLNTKKKVSWSSSDEKVAKVSAKGKVTAKAKGNAVITAKVKGKKYTCKVTVTKKQTMAAKVLAIVNKERKKQGLAALKKNSTLQKAANKRAKEIVEVFSHTRPDGTSCFTVLKEFDITYTACGENIAAGQNSAKSVMTSWMNSPGHKANILSSNFGEIGIGFYQDTKAPYRYYWVQLFKD